jgi:hypothetical protein
MAAVKKRKVVNKNLTLQSSLIEDYLFICIKRAAICIVSN